MFAHFQMWLFLGVFVCFVLSVAVSAVRNRARGRNLEAEAQALGLLFTPWIGPESVPNISTPYLMKDTHAYKNVISGSYAGLEVKVFDYARDFRERVELKHNCSDSGGLYEECQFALFCVGARWAGGKDH